jgi:Zinc knuckle
MNIEASHISDLRALKMLHLTLSGVAQSHYQSSILPKLRAENMHPHSVLDHMSAYYLDKAMQTRAYKEFHTMSFCTFRRSPAWSEKSETEVLRAYVAELQSYQLQMSVVYHTDVYLKDRLVQSFSEANPDVESLFLDNPPPDHREAVGRVLARCSTIPGENTFLRQQAIDAFYTDSRYKNDERFRYSRRDDRRRRKKPISRHNSLCYVCKQPGHFARDRHSRDEIEEASKTGRTISTFISTLSDDVAAIVMAASPEDDSGSAETSADVNLAHVNVQVYEMAEVFDVEKAS